MKKEKKRLSYTIFSLLIIIFITSILYYSSYEKDCGSDTLCFNQAALKCAKASITIPNNSTIFLYTIKGPEDSKCVVNVKVQDIINPTPETEIFIGKDMDCRIQKEIITENFVSDLPSFMQYCSGPLKETMYEVIIQKLYGTVAQNLGEIILEMRKVV